MSDEDTIFDKILRGEIPAKKVFEDDDILAFEDIQAQAPIHVLVIPKKKVSSYIGLADQDDATVGKLFKGAAKVAGELNLNDDGYRVVVNCGANGQQTVDYLHLHILGGRQLQWPPG